MTIFGCQRLTRNHPKWRFPMIELPGIFREHVELEWFKLKLETCQFNNLIMIKFGQIWPLLIHWFQWQDLKIELPIKDPANMGKSVCAPAFIGMIRPDKVVYRLQIVIDSCWYIFIPNCSWVTVSACEKVSKAVCKWFRRLFQSIPSGVSQLRPPSTCHDFQQQSHLQFT